MIFIGVPFAIGVTGRWDFYFTLTSVALLAIASAGVWLTFYIGRINIGQGAFALIGAYVSAILVVKVGWSFWISLPAAGLFAAVVAILIGLPIPTPARRIFRNDNACFNSSCHFNSIGVANHQRGAGYLKHTSALGYLCVWHSHPA